MSFIFSSHRSKHPNGNQGFTLIEMLVVVGIFLVITTVVMADFPGFRDRAALQLVAQEIAVTIRQAQVYGIGTRVAVDDTFSSYGVHFDTTEPNGKRSFALYSDVNGSGSYEESGDVLIDNFAIHGGIDIVALCAGNDCNVGKLDIHFQRFYPDAVFTIDGALSSLAFVKLVIESSRASGNQREIDVWNTGQIIVRDPNAS